jgi:hypothetical protein
MLVTLGHCNTSAMNVSVLHLVFEPAKLNGNYDLSLKSVLRDRQKFVTAALRLDWSTGLQN